LAQLVNVIAPITTNANGLFRQTIYYPYSWGLHAARGAVLNLLLESPVYEVSGIGTGILWLFLGVLALRQIHHNQLTVRPGEHHSTIELIL
jgi:alpha-L-arabinofuranosidase